jgi:gliding motility-associated-like protein
VAQFTVNDTISCAPKQFVFSNTSQLADAYSWRINGTQTTTTFNRPDTTVLNSGQNITVSLIATNVFGCRPDTATRLIQTIANPTPNFTLSADSGCGPLLVNFTNTSSGGTSFLWNLGNDSITTTTNASNVYFSSQNNDSTYNIKLIAFNGPGCKDSITKIVRTFPKPISNFSVSDSANCGPLVVQFTNTSVHKFGGNINNMNFAWRFGNGDSSVTKDPIDTFISSAIQDTLYTIRLIATSRFGCKDTAQKNVRAYPNPRAVFSVDNDNGCGPLPVSFTNASVPNDTGTISMMTFNWNFRNGTTSTQVNPAQTFASNLTKDTFYQVRLIAFSEHGCRDTAFRNILVFPKPLADFVMNSDSGCTPFSALFTNTSTPFDTGNIAMMSFVWNLGNGFGNVTQNAFGNYISKPLVDSTYRVTLFASSEHGCKDTVTKNLVVHPKPVASFSSNKTQGCGPLDVQFNSTSLLANTFKWNFGNGDTSRLANPLAIFQSFPSFDSIYQIRFSVQSIFGCNSDTVSGNIIARYQPSADFIASNDSICSSGIVSFSNQSIGGISNQWNFGNGLIASSINPFSNFQGLVDRDTTYRVRLVVTSPYTCRDTSTKLIKVNPLPDAAFTAIAPGCSPLAALFTNNSIRAVRYLWDFGDGITDSTATPSRLFENALLLTNRDFQIVLKAFTASGCEDTAKQTIRVYPHPLAAVRTNLNDGCGPLQVQFTNQSTADFAGSAGMTFHWDFATGSTSGVVSPTTTFQANATKDTVYNVRLVAISQFGCRDTIFEPIRVYPNPKALFTASDTAGCGPLNISFANTSIPHDTGNINIMTFVWDFGNGFNSVQSNATTQFINPALNDSLFTVRLIASSEHGCKDTTRQAIALKAKPTASFTTNRNEGCGPFDVTFTNTSQLNTQNRWKFGDGDSSVVVSPTHLFQSIRLRDTAFTVSLVTSSSFGCVSDTTRCVITGRYIPIAAFTSSADSVCNPGAVSFFNTSSGANQSNWDFGNGGTSLVVNPVTTFNGPISRDTSYLVRLVVNSPAQCRDTAFKFIKVNPSPDASFAAVPPACSPYPVLFTNTSLRSIAHEWDFGDGTTTSSLSPSKVFNNNVALVNRNYLVSLKAISAGGCSDTATRLVTVYPLPLVDYSINKTLRCDTSEYTTVNNTQGAETFQWKTDRQLLSTAQQPKLYFKTTLLNDTVYALNLVGITNQGCRDSITKPVMVRPLVRAAFSSTGSSSCSNLNVIFTNLSNNGLSYFWLFGDGTGSPLASPQHRYNNTGSYNVQLIAYDAFGCSDTAIRTNGVNVYEVPTANFIYSPPDAALPNSTISFTNLSFVSEGNLTYAWDFNDPKSPSNTSNLRDPSHTFSDSGNYDISLVVQTVNGCTDTSEQALRIRPHPPVPDFVFNPAEGCAPHSVQFTNTTTFSNTYEWTFDDGQKSTLKDPFVTFKFPGKYGAFLRAESPGGIRQIRKDEIIEVFGKPRANFFATPVRLIIPNSTVTLTNISSDAVSWNWRIIKEGRTFFEDTSQNTLYTFMENGMYDVELISYSDKRCSDTLTRFNLIDVLREGKKYIGNAFTPDGDGRNDVFIPVLQGVLPNDYLFEIYNRWGQLVFSTNDAKAGWDGTYQGTAATVDTYVWTVKGLYTGNIPFSETGNVTLLR